MTDWKPVVGYEESMVSAIGGIMSDLDQEMEEMAAEEWNDSQPVGDVRRVQIRPRENFCDGEFIDVGLKEPSGTHALVPWDEWEQALDLQAERDNDWTDHDLATDFNQLSEDYEQLSDELVELRADNRELQNELEYAASRARCATDLWLESWDEEQAAQAAEDLETVRGGGLPSWVENTWVSTAGDPQSWTLNDSYEVPENY